MGEVVQLPVPTVLTAAQRRYWHEQAAYWAVHEEIAQTALEYAQQQRQAALRMLGMLGTGFSSGG